MAKHLMRRHLPPVGLGALPDMTQTEKHYIPNGRIAKIIHHHLQALTLAKHVALSVG
jgi:hypothetical protein